MHLRLGFIGFGVVAQGVVQILHEKAALLRERYALELSIVGIAGRSRGSIYDPDGLPLDLLLKAVEDDVHLEALDAPETGWDGVQLATASNADIIVEMSPTDIASGQPATEYVKAALAAGKHVVTTNKGPVVTDYMAVKELAAANGVQFRCEGTVMSGTPVIDFAERNLAGCRIDRIRGILNGTTNYILTEMEAGMSYAEALRRAQELGYAEADPTADVNGRDALAKVVILADLVMGANLQLDEVTCTGITEITESQIQDALAQGRRWKLIAELERDGDTVRGSVTPKQVDLHDPLASIGGATNAITFSTDLLGDVTVVGAGAGRLETGFSVLADILEIARGVGGER